MNGIKWYVVYQRTLSSKKVKREFKRSEDFRSFLKSNVNLIIIESGAIES